MISSLFLIKLMLSFIVGGLWVTVATRMAEKYGTKLGGMISGLPSTIIFGLFFIGWSQSVDVAAEATVIVPAGLGVTYIFVMVYSWLSKFNFWLGLIAALLSWLVLGIGLIWLRIGSMEVAIVIYLATLGLAYWVLEHKLEIKSQSKKRVRLSSGVLLFRGLMSGSIVALAVLMGKVGGPMWGGLFSVFPAMFTSTLLITYLSQGIEFSVATLKTALLSSVSVFVYGILVRYLYMPLGLWRGTLAAVGASFVFGIWWFRVIGRRVS